LRITKIILGPGLVGGSCLSVRGVAAGFPLAAGLCAAQGDDGGGTVGGPVHSCLSEALAGDALAASSGHAIYVTLAWTALAMALAVTAAVSLARTVLATRRAP
jgi:hypothetical protein